MRNKIAFSAPFGKSDYTIALIFTLITAILCAIKMNGGHHWGDDFAGYIAQGIALAKGEVAQYISENTFMWEKTDWVFGPKAYPWGFPLLLAPIYKIFGFNIYALKSVGVICYALFVGIFYIFCANRLPRIYAIFAGLLFAINPFMIYFSANEVMSDIPFLLFGFVALITLAKLFGKSKDCHDSLRESRKTRRSRSFFSNNGIFIAILGGIFMLFASLIRINGLVIVCALIAMHGILLAKRFAPNLFKARILKPFAKIDSPYPLKIHAIPYIIFVAGFAIIATTLSSGGGGHLGLLQDMNLQSTLKNIAIYIQFFGTFFVVRQAEFASIEGLVVLQSLEREAFVIFLLCVPLILVGIWASLRESSKKFGENLFYCIFVAGFLVVLFVWLGFGFRLAYICLPFFVFWGARGIMWLNNKKYTRLYGRVMGVILLIVLVNFAVGGKENDKITRDGVYSAGAMQIWDFIDKRTPKNAIIIFDKPRALYLYTHRVGFGSHNIKRVDEANFVLCYNEWDKCVGKETEKMKQIYMNHNFTLFEVIK